jgi:hypothetical protein
MSKTLKAPLGGNRISGCSSCQEVFTSLSAFDKHHKTAYGTDTPVTCLDPAEVGLVKNDRGQWRFSGEGNEWWKHDDSDEAEENA